MAFISPGVQVRCISKPAKICAGSLPTVGLVYVIHSVHSSWGGVVSLVTVGCACGSRPFFHHSHFRPIDEEGEIEMEKLRKLVEAPTEIDLPERVLEPLTSR